MVWVQVVGRGSSLTGRRDGVAWTWETRDAGLQRGLSRVALSPRENEEQALRKGAGLIHRSEYLFFIVALLFLGLPEDSYIAGFCIFPPALSFLSGCIHTAITSTKLEIASHGGNGEVEAGEESAVHPPCSF